VIPTPEVTKVPGEWGTYPYHLEAVPSPTRLSVAAGWVTTCRSCPNPAGIRLCRPLMMGVGADTGRNGPRGAIGPGASAGHQQRLFPAPNGRIRLNRHNLKLRHLAESDGQVDLVGSAFRVPGTIVGGLAIGRLTIDQQLDPPQQQSAPGTA
jgi:hypothetical protein